MHLIHNKDKSNYEVKIKNLTRSNIKHAWVTCGNEFKSNPSFSTQLIVASSPHS